MARKSKLTAEVTKSICNFLRAGYFVEDASRMAGISRTTLYRWIDRGKKERDEEEDSLYADFVDAIEKARAEAEGFHLNVINKAASRGVWQASSWWLERSFEKWGKTHKVSLGGDEEAPVNIQIKYSNDK
tara:strand:- start:1380 stop:1769 length:390 start_codon:yes stop_codon:yes gene_type:complete